MKRRINFTNRKKINKSNIEIKINRNNDNEIESFESTVLIDKEKYKDESVVYLEAYHRTDFRRYKLGPVKNIRNLEDESFKDFLFPENKLFRVKVINKDGLITGMANEIHPIDKGKPEYMKRSILPVLFEEDLGMKIWELRYEARGPELYFNSKIDNIETIAKSNPSFFVFVLPQVIKEILYKIIFIDGIDNYEDPNIDWHKDWINFARSLCTDDMPSLSNIDKEEDIRNWIDTVIDSFTINHKEKWDEFKNNLE